MVFCYYSGLSIFTIGLTSNDEPDAVFGVHRLSRVYFDSHFLRWDPRGVKMAIFPTLCLFSVM